MDEAGARKLRFLALQLVGAVAVIHLAVGSAKLVELAANGLLVEYLTEQVFTFPRTALFTVSSVAAFAGIVAAARGRLQLRHAYELGVLLLATYLLGWVAWHTVLNHGAAIGAAPGAESGAHTHGGLVGTLVSHYLDPLLATVGAAASGTPGSGRAALGVVSKTLEIAGMAVLAVLLYADPRIEGQESLLVPSYDR